MKTAVITGASSGLGREFVRQFYSVFPEIERVWLIARRMDRLQELAEQLEEKGISTLTLPLDLCDTMSFTAHKFYGPNGIGALYKRRGLVIEPQISGGASTTIYRSGTPTLGLAVSLDAALTKALDEQDARTAHVQKLHDRLLAELQKYSLVRINSPAQAVPHILNVSVTGVKGTRFQQALSEQGVCVSVKSACSSDGMPSKAVFAVSRDRRNALSSWRISLSHLTTEEEIDGFLQAFDTCYKSLTNKEN